jgi:hypothetical protein
VRQVFGQHLPQVMLVDDQHAVEQLAAQVSIIRSQTASLVAPVLTMGLISRGRRDIPSDAFDDRRPLQLDTRVRVAEILRVDSEPPDRAGLPVAAEGS